MDGIENYGCVKYIEPTDYFNEQRGYGDPIHGNTSDAINFPYENYNIAVDLEVQVANRYSCGLTNSNDEEATKTYRYSSNNGTLSFFSGKNISSEDTNQNFLTTSFTDINYTNPEQDGECFGIESIEIKYDSWIYPQIDIKFTDVRGAAVMTPAEYSYYNKDDYKGNLIYRSFFLYPYPIYRLKVKGLYGAGITYKLALHNVDIDFNSDTGSFTFNATFIGYMYGIYADTPFSFILLAPYLPEGQRYWNEMCAKQRFCFRDENGDIQSEMIRIPELRQRIAEISQACSPEFSNEDGIFIATSDEDIVRGNNQLSALSDIVQDEIIYNLYSKGYYYKPEDEDPNFDYFIVSDYVINTELRNGLDEFFKKLQEYDTAFKTTYLKDYVNPNRRLESFQFSKDENAGSYTYVPEVRSENTMQITATGGYVSQETTVPYSDIAIFGNSTAFEKVKNFAFNKFKDSVEGSKIYILALRKYHNKNLYNVCEILRDDYKTLLRDLKAVSVNQAIEIEEKKLQEIKSVLKFNPSIKNIYNLLFAHFETFIHCFYEKMRSVKEQLSSPNSERLKKAYGITNDETDTPTRPQGVPGENDEMDIYNYLAPYTAYYKEKDDTSETGNVGKELVWPTNIHGYDLTELDDMRFVKELLHAATLEGSELSYEDEGNWAENRWVNPRDFIPSLFVDYEKLATHGSLNPYLNLGFRTDDINTVSNMLGMFAIRLFKFISEDTNISNKALENFGIKEAINVVNAIGDEINESFEGFINAVDSLKKKNFVDLITNLDNKYGIAKGITSETLFSKNGRNKVSYTLKKTFYPLLFDSLQEIKDKEDVYQWGDEKNQRILLLSDNISKNSIVVITEEQYNNIKTRVNAEVIDKVDIPDEFKKRKTDKKINGFKEDIKESWPELKFDKIATVCNYNEFSYDAINERIQALGTDATVYQKAFLFLMRSKKEIRPCASVMSNSTQPIKNWELANKLTMLTEGAYHFMMDETEIDNGALGYSGFKEKFEVRDFIYTTYDKDGFSDRTRSRRYGLEDEFKNWVNDYNNGFMKIATLIGNKSQTAQDEVRKFVENLYKTKVWVLDKYKNRFSTKTTASISDLNNAFDEFLDTLKTVYKKSIKKESAVKQKVNETKIEKGISAANNTDLCLSTYMTMKNLYDKWLSFPDNNEEKWSLNDTEYSEFSHFLFVDTFYNDIGYKLNVNVSKLSNWFSKYMPSSNSITDESEVNKQTKTFYEFLADIAQDCGGLLLALPQNICIKDENNKNGTDINVIRQMFTPVSFSENTWGSNNTTFLFMYTYKPSSIAGDGEENAATRFDLNGYNQTGDGFNITDNVATTLFCGRSVPAFGVTFGKQNQSIFRKIGLNTNTTTTTEASIAGTFNVASKAGDGVRESMLYGQDLYKVRGSYSYNCSVETMGNVQIMPTMYFQLNNIPLWKGVYQIMKVTHNIVLGNMTTSFEGVKINKYALPFAKPQLPVIDSGIIGLHLDDIEEIETYERDFVPSEGSGNRKDLKNISENGDFKLANIDFMLSDTEHQIKIICLTPAHASTHNDKWLEHWWSTKLCSAIRQKLIKSVKNPWLKDCVHICNDETVKRAKLNGGYDLTETRQFIKYFGDNSVISVVPHWNAGAATATYGSAIYKSKNNEYVKVPNPKSVVLANCFINAFENLEIPKNTIAEKAMQTIQKNDLTDLNASASDGATDLSCPCVLFETWFCDYSDCGTTWGTFFNECKGVKKQFKDYSISFESIKNKQNENIYSKYKDKIFAAWLMSEEGLDVISNFYANAIEMFLETLEQ